MPFLGGAGGASTSDLDKLAALADVLADPAKLKAVRDDLNTRVKAAEDAETAANARIAESSAASAALAAREKTLVEREAAEAIERQSLDERMARYSAWEAKLTADQSALDAATADFAKAQAAALTANDEAQRDAATRLANASAALDQRARDLQAREAAVATNERLNAEAKQMLDERAARMIAAAS